MNANPHNPDTAVARDNAVAHDAVANDVDHTIDRALSALRDAQPRSGLNTRILVSLEQHSASRTTAPGGRPFYSFVKALGKPGWPTLSLAKGWGIVCGSKRESGRRTARLALWATTAAAALAVASLAILHHHNTPTELALAPQASTGLTAEQTGVAAGFSPRNSHAESNGASAPARLLHTPSSRQPRASHSGETGVPGRLAGRGAETPAFKNCADHPGTGCPIDDAVAINAASTTPTDAQALADLHAPSHPPPPLPLTPQEELLLHGLRYTNLTQLAELNPEVRARQDAEETAAFKTFFPDPPPLKQPLGDTE